MLSQIVDINHKFDDMNTACLWTKF